MDKYSPKGIESKWQDAWEKAKLYQAKDFSDAEKYYLLIEFPYPSGAGLHVGHVRSWSAMDAFARKKRMEGLNVMFPIGWDAFGLPAENYAIKTGIHPSKTVPENIANFKRQIKSLGLSFDWEREVNTSDPEYYRFTQWIFLKLFEKGLAYQDEVTVNWCPTCKTNLADEEVMADGRHERCGNQTEKRAQKQWLLAITKYADRLIDDLSEVDFSKDIKTQQINWIGRSEGTKIKFPIKGGKESLEVFTTRPDTLHGATFIVLACQSPLLKTLVTKEFEKEVDAYLKREKKEIGEKEKDGVFTGSYAVNPATKKDVPIYVSDYVVEGYGVGAIMGVPAHDERDWQFAQKYNLPIIEVISGGKTDKEPYLGEGKIVNSEDWNGYRMPVEMEKVISDITRKGWGTKAVSYHLHDWVFSRQHYWGEPIPIIHCPDCGPVPVPEADLPVKLPFLSKYEPSGTGESPLANVTDWLKVKCPKCGKEGRRETDTMPNWAGSNWYFVRYCDPKNDKELAAKDKMKYWLPVDMYQGGYEHITLHLLYSRFIYKFLYDIGVVPTSEPYKKRRSHGIVLGPDGRKMSKSLGNVISPDEIVAKYGADTLRLYEMFMGPFDQMNAWSEESLEGCFRFLGRLYRLFQSKIGTKSNPELSIKLNQTIKKVSNNLEDLKFNTAVAFLMELANAWNDDGDLSSEEAEKLTRLISPFAPHLAEEVWVNILKKEFSVTNQPWPEYDKSLGENEKVTVVIQVNGKVRSQIILDKEAVLDKENTIKLAQKDTKVLIWLKEKHLKDTIFVPGRLINFVVE